MPRRLPLHTMPIFSMLALAACGENVTPTQPDVGGDPGPAALSPAAAPNSWTLKAPPPFPERTFGFDLGTAPNSAGQSIVYTFGGTFEDGGTGLGVAAYNVATDTWTKRLTRIFTLQSNGVGKIGSKLYFSGGNNQFDLSEKALWAYDYSGDQLIRKADLPIYSAEGVTGVIDGKLYVLPGACDGARYPAPGSCADYPTRRFYRYDPATNTWATLREAPHFHRRGAAAVLDGRLYVAGEVGGLADLDVYDPPTDTWRTLAPMPVGGAASGTALQGQFFVVVKGSDVSSPVIRAYAYDRVTNQWKARAAPPFSGQ